MHQYIRHELLCNGSCGAVYRISDIHTKINYALKIVFCPGKDKESLVLREIFCLNKLENHKGIISLKHWWEKDKTYYLVLELLDKDIREIVGRDGMDPTSTKKLIKQIVEAVKYCHVNNIIHRDIRSENIMLDFNGNPKLIDFNLAITQADAGEFDILTLNKYPFNPACQPPEVILWRNQNTSVDVWSLGILIHELMTGLDLFDPLETGDTNAIRQVVLNCSDDNIDLSAILDPSCQHLVSQMLKYNPSERIGMDEILGHPWLKC